MKEDRYSQNHKLYILGIICLILSLGLIFFSLYILPFLIWGFGYNVPEYIHLMLSYFQDQYYFSYIGSATIVWLIFFIPGAITGLISYYASNSIDNRLLRDELAVAEEGVQPEENNREQLRESVGLGFKILALMLLVVVIILFLQFILF